MLTSCPECKTTFRLSQEQLGLRRGLVRCGRCKAVFNAYHTLLPDLIEPPPSEGTPADIEVQQEIEPIERQVDVSAPLESSPDIRHVSLPAEATPRRLSAYDDALADALSSAQAANIEEIPDKVADDILLSELPTRAERSVGSGWRSVIYALASVLLLMLLALQAAYFFRADLASSIPESRPWLQKLCGIMQCTVALPHRLDKRAIVASSLEHDAERASRVRLTLLLANRSGDVQTWPQVLLTLTDLKEAPVAIKTFPPAIYLPSGLKEAAGMAPGSEVEIRLELDLGKLEAAGYNLDLVYP